MHRAQETFNRAYPSRMLPFPSHSPQAAQSTSWVVQPGPVRSPTPGLALATSSTIGGSERARIFRIAWSSSLPERMFARCCCLRRGTGRLVPKARTRPERVLCTFVALISMIWFNQSALEGVTTTMPDRSWTLDQLLELCKRITRPTGDPYSSTWGYAVYTAARGIKCMARAWGGETFSADGKKSLFSTEPVVNAVTWIYDMMHRHRVAPTAGRPAGDPGRGEHPLRQRAGAHDPLQHLLPAHRARAGQAPGEVLGGAPPQAGGGQHQQRLGLGVGRVDDVRQPQSIRITPGS